MMKLIEKLVLVFTALALIAGIGIAFLPMVLESRTRGMIEDIKKRGEPVSPAELAGPIIPDSRNAAVVYARMFGELSTSEAQEDFRSLPGLEELNADADPELWNQTREVVAKYRHLIPVIREAQARPECRFDVNWEDGWTQMKQPHLGPLRRAGQLLHWDALLNAREGRLHEAVRSVEMGFAMGEALRDEPNLIAQLVRIAINSTAADALCESLRYGRIDEEQARHLSNTLTGIELRSGHARALQGERAMTIAMYDDMREDPGRLSEAIDNLTPADSSSKKSETEPRDVEMGGFWRAWMYADERFYLATMEKLIDLSTLPYHDIKAEHPKAMEEIDRPRYASPVSALCLNTFRVESWDRCAAKINGSRILLALSVYKGRNGSYPETLADLRDGLGWDVPGDPFSGEDFIYKREGQGFILYSVGPNLRDDAGQPEPKRQKGSTPSPPSEEEPATDDIAWRMES